MNDLPGKITVPDSYPMSTVAYHSGWSVADYIGLAALVVAVPIVALLVYLVYRESRNGRL